MKIKKIPITDLVVYFNELFDNRANEDFSSIPAMIEEYYYIITKISLPSFESIFLDNWCFGNIGEIDYMPWTSGVIVKNKEGQYGITSWVGPQDIDHNETDLLNVLWIDHGIINRKVFHPNEWELWGIMPCFFEYNIDDGINCLLGMRNLRRGMAGRDVWMLQKLMKTFDDTVELNAQFDEAMENKVIEIQTAFSLPATGLVLANDKMITLLGGR